MANILIVDDSWLTRRFLSGILQKEGHLVKEADSGMDALAALETFSPDCILLDLLMPKMDGFAVMEVLDKKGLRVPIVVITADIQDTTREKCHSLGAVGFVNKPPNAKALLETVKSVLEER